MQCLSHTEEKAAAGEKPRRCKNDFGENGMVLRGCVVFLYEKPESFVAMHKNRSEFLEDLWIDRKISEWYYDEELRIRIHKRIFITIRAN